MRALIGIGVEAVWLAQKGRVFRVVAGARTRGRCVGCTLGFGVSVGAVVVLVGGWCGVGGTGERGGVGVGAAGVFVRRAADVLRGGWVRRGAAVYEGCAEVRVC
jgi:hypothetical protein